MAKKEAAVVEFLWTEVRDGLHNVPLDLIVESPENARKTFPMDALQTLADSIKEDGGINTVPVKVRPIPLTNIGQMFELVDGARRFRAMKMIGASVIKAEVEEITDDALAFKRSLICNLVREDLNPLEKSAAFEKLMQKGRYKSVGALAKALGMTEYERSIYDLLSLNKLIDPVKEAVASGKLPLAHAVLIARETSEDQAKAFEACFRPEAIDNGGGMEMVPTLISERALRRWIQDSLRPEPAKTAEMFDNRTEAEKADDANSAELEKQADEILEGQQPETSEQPAEAAQPAAPQASAKKDESDIDDDDLNASQRAAVQPEAAGEYQAEQEKRIERARGMISRISYPWPTPIYKALAVRLAGRLSVNQLTAFMQLTGYALSPVQQQTLIDHLESLNMRNTNDVNSCARAIVAILLIDEVNPNTELNLLPQLETMLESLLKGREPEAAPSKKVASKTTGKPVEQSLSDVMKAEKAKVAKKNAAKAKAAKKSPPKKKAKK